MLPTTNAVITTGALWRMLRDEARRAILAIARHRHTQHLDAYAKARETQSAHDINVADIHRNAMSTNDRIASWIAEHVGTMIFCYYLASFMTTWAVAQALLQVTTGHAFDPYPYQFLFFILGGIMQSLLMPLLMVASNLQNRQSDLRSIKDYEVNQASFAKLEELERIVAAQQVTMMTQFTALQELIAAKKPARAKNGVITQKDDPKPVGV